MVTKAEKPVVEDENDTEAVVRNIIAGHPKGAVRRIVLYIILFAAMGLAYYWAPLVVVAIVAGILLATTDQLV